MQGLGLGSRALSFCSRIPMALQDEIDSYGLNIVGQFRPLRVGAARTASEVHFNASCMPATPLDTWGPTRCRDRLGHDQQHVERGFWFFLNFEAERIDWTGP